MVNLFLYNFPLVTSDTGSDMARWISLNYDITPDNKAHITNLLTLLFTLAPNHVTPLTFKTEEESSMFILRWSEVCTITDRLLTREEIYDRQRKASLAA